MLLVLNKIDAITSPAILNRVLDRYPNAIPVSAKSRRGLTALTEAVGEALSEEFLDVHVEVAPADGKLLAHLAATGEVLSKEYSEDRVTVHVRMSAAAFGLVRERALAVRPAKRGQAGEDVIPPLKLPQVPDDAVDVNSTGEVA